MCMVQRCKSPCFPSSLSTGAAETKEDFCPVKSHEVVVMLSCHLNLCILHPFSLYWLVFVLWLCCCRYAMSCDPTHGGKCSRLANFNCRGTQCALGCGWFYLSWHGVMMRQGMGVGWGEVELGWVGDGTVELYLFICQWRWIWWLCTLVKRWYHSDFGLGYTAVPLLALKCRSTRLCKTITWVKSETFLIQSACLNGVVLFLSLPNRWTFNHQIRLDHCGPQNWPTVQGKWPGMIAQCSILVAGGIDRKVGNEELACVVKQSKGHWIQLCELNCCKCCTHLTTAVWLSTVLEQLLKGTPSEAAWARLKM